MNAKACRNIVVLLALVLWFSPCAMADNLEVRLLGLEPDMQESVAAQIGGGWISGAVLNSPRRRSRFINRSETNAVIALRPFGYYFATVSSRLEQLPEGSWVLTLDIDKGDPVLIRNLDVQILGPGAEHPDIEKWLEEWPLPEGAILDQPAWDEEKQEFNDITEELGFLLAEYTQHRIELDLENNRADLVLEVQTGPRALMGDINFIQDSVEEGVLTPVARFNPGDNYRGWLVETLRTDLWKLGFYDDIDIEEKRNLEADPPVVDLEVTLVEGNRATHQGTLGYGTDTDFRMQYRWQRHLLSERGDSLSAGFGLQSRRNELLLFGEYRLPRQVSSHQYWLVNPILKREDQDFFLDLEGTDQRVSLGSGTVNDLFLRFGRAKLRNPTISREQIIETIHLSYLHERNEISTIGRPIPTGDLDKSDLLGDRSTQSLAVGMEWDWPVVQGTGFHTWGHRERAWWFHSDDAWGSDVQYTQLYLSTRWNFLFGDRFKLLLRGEAGWSDARVQEIPLEIDGINANISVTELPFQYRFKAGGSYSVRGYDFETLSNNGIGSNNIITASVELEYLFREQWSVAAFYDAGNAFNDWSNSRLRKGVGVGIRWYTIGFPIRIDVAQALDLEDRPWRFHITIGSPLL